jgi:DNA-binding transcriptional MerR regulator
MKTSYSIGEFSQVTGLSVKTLRFYHEKGILVPSSVDDATGYRCYDSSKIEKARDHEWFVPDLLPNRGIATRKCGC